MDHVAPVLDAVMSCYGKQGAIFDFEAADSEIRFRMSAAVIDPESAGFRSGAPVLNALAIGHRLSVIASRSAFDLPNDGAIAIRNIQAGIGSTLAAAQPDRLCEVALRMEVSAIRYGRVTGLETVLTLETHGEAWRVQMSLDVLPAALVQFVRKGRGFSDFSETPITGDGPRLERTSATASRYFPGERDRISDGHRVDHVPALTLIDLALLVVGKDRGCAPVTAEFLRYADPRRPLDIMLRDHLITFRQDGESVAAVVVSGS